MIRTISRAGPRPRLPRSGWRGRVWSCGIMRIDDSYAATPEESHDVEKLARVGPTPNGSSGSINADNRCYLASMGIYLTADARQILASGTATDFGHEIFRRS